MSPLLLASIALSIRIPKISTISYSSVYIFFRDAQILSSMFIFFKLANFIAATRPGISLLEAQEKIEKLKDKYNANIISVYVPSLDISSTYIRVFYSRFCCTKLKVFLSYIHVPLSPSNNRFQLPECHPCILCHHPVSPENVTHNPFSLI